MTGCPIRKSWGQGSFAPNPSLSQLVTSFIASESQGIHRLHLTFSLMPLFFRIYLLLVTLDCLFNLVVFYLQSFCVSMSKIVVLQPNIDFHTEWRITDSNRWPPACKAGALASWANPPFQTIPKHLSLELKYKGYSLRSPTQSWTADLYIISVAL